MTARVGFAIVGSGNIAGVHARAISETPRARVAVVCGRNERTARDLAEACGADWTTDLAGALARPDVHAVSVCTPSGTHAEIAEQAAGAGKHLLVEKPIEVTLPRADRVIAAARAHGVLLACVFPYRFRRGVAEALRALESGRLGRLALASAEVRWFRPRSYYEGTWRGTWELDGGGALMNQSIHTIDLLQWLGGPVESVYGRTATVAHDIRTEDAASAVLELRSGATATIQGSTACWPGEPARVGFYGERGTIVLEEGRIVAWQLSDAPPGEERRMLALEAADGSGSRDPMAIGHKAHRLQVLDLVRAILEGGQPAIPGEEARRPVELIRAIYHSARTGRAVRLPFDDVEDNPQGRSTS